MPSRCRISRARKTSVSEFAPSGGLGRFSKFASPAPTRWSWLALLVWPSAEANRFLRFSAARCGDIKMPLNFDWDLAPGRVSGPDGLGLAPEKGGPGRASVPSVRRSKCVKPGKSTQKQHILLN